MNLDKKQRPRHNPAQWQEIVEHQKASGKTVADYCRERNLCKTSFYSWRKRLKERTGPQLKDFIEVPGSATSRERSLRVTTPGGYCLDVREGTDSAFLKEIIVALGSL